MEDDEIKLEEGIIKVTFNIPNAPYNEAFLKFSDEMFVVFFEPEDKTYAWAFFEEEDGEILKKYYPEIWEQSSLNNFL